MMILKSLLFVLLYNKCTTASVHHFNKNCLDLTADILISSDYKDALGATKTSSYNVPPSYNDTSACKDNFLSKKNARYEIVFNQDKLVLEFQAPAISGKTISLISVNYTYNQDRLRFPGILKESLQSASRTFAEDEFPIGVWKKVYKCADVTISVGNVTIELTNLKLVVFRTEDSKEETKCPESEAFTNAKTSAVVKPVVFNNSCVSGSMVIVITGKYADKKGLSRSFEFFAPGNAKVETVCVDSLLKKKQASMKISYPSDILELNLTAPAVYGDDISLTTINFTIVLDKTKFPDIGNPKTERVVRDFSTGDYVLGEWGKRNKCPSVLLNMGSGLKVELRNISLAIFRANKATKEKECPAPLFVPRLRKL